MNHEETRILRWSEQEHIAYSPDNKGKALTDNNPYLTLNSERFDIYTEAAPPQIDAMICVSFKIAIERFAAQPDLPKLKPVFLDYLDRIHASDLSFDYQMGRNDSIEPKEYNEAEKLILKQEILAELEKRDLIGGFTLIDRRYINYERDDLFPYDTILIIGGEMIKDAIMEIPYPTSQTDIIFDFDVYDSGGVYAHEIADFIRSKGVRALGHVPFKWEISFDPHAINAGMGNYTTHGLMLTTKWGTRFRLYAVSIDLDLPIDKPKEYNFEEFCKRCRMCYKSCPGCAIPRDEDEFYGAKKRRVSPKRCGHTMSTNNFCGVCLKVCPFSNFEYETLMGTLPQYNMYNTIK